MSSKKWEFEVPTFRSAAEFVADALVAWFVFYVLKEWLIDEAKNLADQPLVTAACIGGAWFAYKVARNFDLIKGK